MSRDLKGRVKEPLWTKPTCMDDSDQLQERRKARRDFKKHNRGDGINVVSPDAIAEAQELGDPPVEQDDFPEE